VSESPKRLSSIEVTEEMAVAGSRVLGEWEAGTTDDYSLLDLAKRVFLAMAEKGLQDQGNSSADAGGAGKDR
jgi:hypothetical protein